MAAPHVLRQELLHSLPRVRAVQRTVRPIRHYSPAAGMQITRIESQSEASLPPHLLPRHLRLGGCNREEDSKLQEQVINEASLPFYIPVRRVQSEGLARRRQCQPGETAGVVGKSSL